jgi:hypothetical protein
MTTANRANQQDRNRKMIAATQKYLMKLTAIVVAGVTYTPDQIVARLQQEIATADAATQARATFLTAAAAVQAQRVAMKPFLSGFRAFLENMFTDPSTITEFGFSPRKTKQSDTVTKAMAADKRLATRKARHTMGKNQKKDVKGTIAPVVTSAPSAVSPPAAPSPATSAPATSAPATSAPTTSAPLPGTSGSGPTPHGT